MTGCCIARTLSKYNLKIAVLEKESDIASGTTKANSGVVHAGYASPREYIKRDCNVTFFLPLPLVPALMKPQESESDDGQHTEK